MGLLFIRGLGLLASQIWSELQFAVAGGGAEAAGEMTQTTRPWTSPVRKGFR